MEFTGDFFSLQAMKALTLWFQGIIKLWVTGVICEILSSRDDLDKGFFPLDFLSGALPMKTVYSEISISLGVRAVRVTPALNPSTFKIQLRCPEEDAVIEE